VSYLFPAAIKELNSVSFPLLLAVELNDTDVDRMLPSLLERAVKLGRASTSKTDTGSYNELLLQLAESSDVQGFDDERGLEVLDGWLRTSVVRMATVGLKRAGEQMDFVVPLSLAAYRSGLPKARSRNRKADVLIYEVMKIAQSRSANAEGGARREIQQLFERSLGHGVNLGAALYPTPAYDGTSEVDINSLLELRFLEKFPEAVTGRQDNNKSDEEYSLMGALMPLGDDPLRLLQAFGEDWSESELISGLAAVLSLRLYQLPLRTAFAIQQLQCGQHALDISSENDTNTLEIYCDFTGIRGSASDELARLCVARDIELMRKFLTDRIRLRAISLSAAMTTSHKSVNELAPPERLVKLLAIAEDPEINMAMLMQLRQFESLLGESPETLEVRTLISNLEQAGISGTEQLTAVLLDGLRKRGLENQVKWMWSTGGLVNKGPEKPYALLKGSLRHKSSWRYAPSEELLVVLLSMCFIEKSGNSASRLPLLEVLARLKDQFGILIAEPPSSLDSADARSGTSENLRAFTSQLQLMGCFVGLSDDFSAQFVYPPRER
jgi:hypothetical protein